MKKKQFMTSVAMVAIVANGMIQTAPAETATEHSEGIQVVQNTSEVVSTGSVEEAKENLKQAKENTKQTKKQLDDAEQKLQEANSDKDTANQAYEEQVKAETSRCLSCGASVVDPNKCIGCGVCTTKCVFDAIHLHREIPGASIMRASEDKLKYILPNMVKQSIKVKFKKKK